MSECVVVALLAFIHCLVNPQVTSIKGLTTGLKQKHSDVTVEHLINLLGIYSKKMLSKVS